MKKRNDNATLWGIAFTLLITLCSAQVARGVEQSSMYTKANLGYGWGTGLKMRCTMADMLSPTTTGSIVTSKFQRAHKQYKGFEGGIGVGRFITDVIRADLAVNYALTDNKTTNGVRNYISRKSLEVMANIYYDFRIAGSRSSQYIPFITAGVGLEHGKFVGHFVNTSLGTYSASTQTNDGVEYYKSGGFLAEDV